MVYTKYKTHSYAARDPYGNPGRILKRINCFASESSQSSRTRRLRIFADGPVTTWSEGTLLVTVARAPTTARSPIVTPGPTNASAAIQTSSPITMGGLIRGKRRVV